MTTRPWLPRDLRSTPTYRWAEQFLRGLGDGGDDQIVDAIDLSTSPDWSMVAMTAWQRGPDGTTELTASIAVIDLSTRDLRLLTRRGDNIHGPAWLLSGKELVAIRTTATGDLPIVLALDGTMRPATTTTFVGRIENILSSPASDHIGLIVAEPGAEISDVYGSGRVTGGAGHPCEHPSWQPEVSAEGRSGRRRLWTAALGGAAAPLASEWNIWEVCWAGNEAFMAVASPGPEEDAWYDAELVHIPRDGSATRSLLRSDRQLGQPRVNATGTRASIIVGTASDRGLMAGDVTIIDLIDFSTTQLPAGLHVTSQHWEPSGGLIVAGQRGTPPPLNGMAPTVLLRNGPPMKRSARAT